MLVTVIIIAGIAVSAFLLSLMLSKKSKLRADKFLILYFLFFIVSQVYFYLEAQGTFQHTAWMLAGRGIYLLGGPIFFYYVYTLTTAARISRKVYVLTLLPFLFYLIHFLYYYLIGFKGHDVTIENGLLYINGHLPLTWTFFVVLLVISDPFYLAWFYLLLRKYRQYSVHEASNFDQINLNWLNIIFYLWVISVVIALPVLTFSVGQDWFSSVWISLLLQLVYLLFVFLLGFYGFRQSTVFSISPSATPSSADTKKSGSYERSGLTAELASAYHEQLLTLMKNQKPYLDGELTAQELARQLGLSPNHLSQVINQQESKNFFDFVNSYRVEEIKRKMADSQTKNLTLLAIALESGFNSKTSFNTVFKKMTGQTPSQYAKALENPSEARHS